MLVGGRPFACRGGRARGGRRPPAAAARFDQAATALGHQPTAAGGVGTVAVRRATGEWSSGRWAGCSRRGRGGDGDPPPGHGGRGAGQRRFGWPGPPTTRGAVGGGRVAQAPGAADRRTGPGALPLAAPIWTSPHRSATANRSPGRSPSARGRDRPTSAAGPAWPPAAARPPRPRAPACSSARPSPSSAAPSAPGGKAAALHVYDKIAGPPDPARRRLGRGSGWLRRVAARSGREGEACGCGLDVHVSPRRKPTRVMPVWSASSTARLRVR